MRLRVMQGGVRIAERTVRVRGAGSRRALVRLTARGRRVVRRARRSMRLVVRMTVDGRARSTRTIRLQ